MILSFLGGLIGCRRVPEYSADDIRSLSISCGHMDYSHSYSYYLRKGENGWLLDAEYSRDTESPRVKYEECAVAAEDVKELLDIVEKQEIVKKLRHCKKSRSKIVALDDTSYYTSILFGDGEQLGAAKLISRDMEEAFCRLAEKYSSIAPGADCPADDAE